MKKGKVLGVALLVLTIAGALLVFSVPAPEEALESKSPPPVSARSEQPQEADPPSLSYQENPTAGASNELNNGNEEMADVQPDSDPALGEAEMEHLNDVFLNSVYPSFQYDFELDLEGRAAIDAFVASMPEDLSSQDLEAISGMIETQLQSPEAEDLAFIITHLYRLEREEARLMNEGPPVTTMEGQLEAQQELSRLRDEWFGPELSERLFGADNTGAISADPGPAESQPESDSTDEPPEAQTEAQAELADIESDWERRYQEFLDEKQIIDRAGLDQAEKDRQIETLMQQHYTPQELEAAKAYGELQQ